MNRLFMIGFGFISSKVVGHVKSLPSKGGLQACAGGVTGASEHIDNKNIGSAIINLFIRVLTKTWLLIILSFIFISIYHNYWCNDTMKLTKVFLSILCVLSSHLESNDRISICSISQLTQKSTIVKS